MQYVYYCPYMLLDVYGALQDRFGRILGQNAKFAPQTRRNSLLAKYFANSEIFQNLPR